MTIPCKHPSEIEVWYILPAIRKELVLTLKEKGYSQKEIARFLNITEPAVSQYTKEKRGKKIIFNEEVKTLIKKSAEEITNSRTAFQQIQKISDFIKHSKARCDIHRQLEENLCGCDLCYRR